MKEESKDFPNSFYRVCVKALITKDNKILLEQLPDNFKWQGGHWLLPGGGLDFGEDIQEALTREIQEELHTKVRTVSHAPLYTWINRYEEKRNLDWYYDLVLLHKVEIEDFSFSPSYEVQNVQYFTLDEIQSLPLTDQTTKLRSLIRLEDVS